MGRKRRTYVPTAEGNLKTWLANLKVKIFVHGSAIGLTSAEKNDILAICDRNITNIDNVDQLKNDLHEAIDNKNTAKNADLKETGRLIGRAKMHSGYTTAIGEDMDVIGDEISLDESEQKPVLTIKKVPNGWEISFNLLGYFEGVNIYRKRPGDADFSFLAMDTSSPYLDNDTMENGTQYYAYFIDNRDEKVGQPGDIITIKV